MSAMQRVCRHPALAAQHARSIMQGNTRQISTQTAAVTKLKQAFQEYRAENYTQTLPSRFKKEVICAVDRNSVGLVSLDDMDRLLLNIGAADKLTREELESILSEWGVKATTKTTNEKLIPTERIRQLL